MFVKRVLLIIAVSMLVLAAVSASRSFATLRDQMIDTSLLHAMVVENVYRMEAGRQIKFLIVDARSTEEYKEAHVLGAVSIPEKDFEKYKKDLPKDRTALVVVYCNDTKCIRSRRWATKAVAAGFSNIVIYSDGFPHWREQRMPIAY
jgi:rhodanese-related sulfurtransferase